MEAEARRAEAVLAAATPDARFDYGHLLYELKAHVAKWLAAPRFRSLLETERYWTEPAELRWLVAEAVWQFLCERDFSNPYEEAGHAPSIAAVNFLAVYRSLTQGGVPPPRHYWHNAYLFCSFATRVGVAVAEQTQDRSHGVAPLFFDLDGRERYAFTASEADVDPITTGVRVDDYWVLPRRHAQYIQNSNSVALHADQPEVDPPELYAWTRSNYVERLVREPLVPFPPDLEEAALQGEAALERALLPRGPAATWRCTAHLAVRIAPVLLPTGRRAYGFPLTTPPVFTGETDTAVPLPPQFRGQQPVELAAAISHRLYPALMPHHAAERLTQAAVPMTFRSARGRSLFSAVCLTTIELLARQPGVPGLSRRRKIDVLLTRIALDDYFAALADADALLASASTMRALVVQTPWRILVQQLWSTQWQTLPVAAPNVQHARALLHRLVAGLHTSYGHGGRAARAALEDPAVPIPADRILLTVLRFCYVPRATPAGAPLGYALSDADFDAVRRLMADPAVAVTRLRLIGQLLGRTDGALVYFRSPAAALAQPCLECGRELIHDAQICAAPAGVLL
jgi:hypothetical protein